MLFFGTGPPQLLSSRAFSASRSAIIQLKGGARQAGEQVLVEIGELGLELLHTPLGSILVAALPLPQSTHLAIELLGEQPGLVIGQQMFLEDRHVAVSSRPFHTEIEFPQVLRAVPSGRGGCR